MSTKFHQLRIGQQFHCQGEAYEKINPLLARNLATGAQRLIPRSTSVTLPDGREPPPAAVTPATGPDLAEVRRAVEDYHRSCLHWLEQQDGSLEKLRLAQEAMTRSRQRVLTALGEDTGE